MMNKQDKHDNDRFITENRKKRHIDIDGIIDKQIRADGLIRDVHNNRIIHSKPINMYDYRFKNQGGSWKPTKFSHEELLILYNVRSVTLQDGNYYILMVVDDNNPMNMRVLRGANGRGMGDMFIEKRAQVSNEPIKDSNSVKLSSSVWVNFYENDPNYYKRSNMNRESIFQAYSKYYTRSMNNRFRCSIRIIQH
jgi:hypothetical protein